MSKNTKIYMIYILSITINLLLGTLFLSFQLGYGGSLIPVFWKGAGLGLVVMIAETILLSWLSNLLYYFIFRKEYEIKMLYFCPIAWEPKRGRLNIDFWPSRLMEICTKISYENIKSIKDIERYWTKYQGCIDILFKVNILTIIIGFVAGIAHSVILGLFLASAAMIYLITNLYEHGRAIEIGLWNRGRKKEWAFEIFTDLITEEFDKTFLYHYFQESRKWTLKESTEIRFFTYLLYDCIAENRDYLTKKSKEVLENLFLYTLKLEDINILQLRLVRIYYIYLKETIGEKEPILEKRIRENWKQIEEKMFRIPFGMKALLSLQKKERYTMEDWYQIYENKMEKIYS